MSVLALAMLTAFSGTKYVAPPGEVVFENTTNKSITVSWTVPAGVTDISMVLIGGCYGDSTQTAFSGAFYANSGNQDIGGGRQVLAAASTYVSTGGGSGGKGGGSYVYFNSGYNQAAMNAGAGGGAGGYTGAGGAGGAGSFTTNGASSAYGAGGVGLYGQGASGSGMTGNSGGTRNGSAGAGGAAGGGCTITAQLPNSNSTGGSGGANGSISSGGKYGGGNPGTPSGLYIYYSEQEAQVAGTAWNGKGGGGLLWVNGFKVTAGATHNLTIAPGGAMRILWGGGRSFPNNAAAI